MYKYIVYYQYNDTKDIVKESVNAAKMSEAIAEFENKAFSILSVTRIGEVGHTL